MTIVASHREAAPTSRISRAVVPLAVAAAVSAATGYIATHNPHSESIFPKCIFLHSTGYYCPGCGGTRAVYDLAHGDFAGAFQMNAFVTVLFLPPAVLGLAWWILRAVGVKLPDVRTSATLVWLYVAAVGVFWVVRNLPGMEFLRP